MKYSDNIIAYLNGELTGKTLQEFEAEMHQNTEFAEEVSFQRSVQEGLFNIQKEDKLLKMSRRVRQADDRKERMTRWAYSGGLSIAASLLVLFLIFPPGGASLSGPEAFQAYFQPENVNEISFEEVELVAITADNPEAMLEEAKKAFSNENYDEAVEGFGSLITQGQFLDQARLYQGASYLALDQADQALNAFNQLADYQEHAKWFTAMAYLQKGETDNAVDQLNRIIEIEQDLNADSQVYTEKARKLLKDLGE